MDAGQAIAGTQAESLQRVDVVNHARDATLPTQPQPAQDAQRATL